MRTRSGLTLVEVLVVLVIMSVALAVVGVAFAPRDEHRLAELQDLVNGARSTAVRRAESMRLDIAPSGAWTLAGDASAEREGHAAAGRLAHRPTRPLAIVISPFGTCALDIRSEIAGGSLAMNPSTCQLGRP